MKTLTTFLKMFVLGLSMASFLSGEAKAQVEIPKDEWTAYAFRYQQERPVEDAIDGDLETKFGMGGSASEGRWFMVDLGESYDVTKVVVTYVPGEQWKNNFILGFDLYVTDYEYPVNAASAPKEQGGDDVDGELFTAYPDSVTATVPYPEATETMELEFPATKGRYVWIVSNGPTGDWWEIHEISVYKAETTDELEIPKDSWAAYAFRYQQDRPTGAAIDGDLETKFGMGGSASEGRWFMVDMGESYDVGKVVLTYVPGEQWKNNYILGFDLYVTDYEYPVNAASAPKEQGGDDVDGELFTPYPDSVTASVAYPEATETMELEFPATKGRYVWIVSNGPTSDWWELHEISVFKAETTSVSRGLKADGFNIYPNPMDTNGYLIINIEEDGSRELIINDMAGRMVYRTRNLEQGLNTLELNLNSGVYILNMPGYQSKKLIVK